MWGRTVTRAARRSASSCSPALAPSRRYASEATATAASQNTPSNIDAEDPFDVTVVGGGPAGLAFLHTLSHISAHAWRAALVDRGEGAPPCDTNNAPLRTVALTPRSVQFLRDVGVWPRLLHFGGDETSSPAHALTHSPFPVYEIAVRDVASDTTLNFDSPPGTSADGCMAHIVSVDWLAQQLHAALPSTVRQFHGHSVDANTYSSAGGYAKFTLRSPASSGTLRSKLVVASDGAQSPLRSAINIPSASRTYGQWAVVVTATVDAPASNHVAYQTFLENGDVAGYLPLHGNMCNVVLSTSAVRGRELAEQGKTNPNVVLEAVNGAMRGMWSRVPLLKEVKAVGAFPLGLNVALEGGRGRCAVVGDAAHQIHPMAGQGLNLGLYDCISLANTLHSQMNIGGDIGSDATLQSYGSKVQMYTVPMVGAIEGIKWSFAQTSGPIRLLRPLGLNVLQKLGPLKHMISSTASGVWVPRGIV